MAGVHATRSTKRVHSVGSGPFGHVGVGRSVGENVGYELGLCDGAVVGAATHVVIA